MIFGTGTFAELAALHFRLDSPFEVVGFCADAPAVKTFAGLPVVPAADLTQRFPPRDHDAFVAVGYRELNRSRAAVCERLRGLGYRLASHVSPRSTHWPDLVHGDNCFVFEGVVVQPSVVLGDGVVLWSGCHVGHHSRIGSFCFVAPAAAIGGHVIIGAGTFVGINATVRDGISIGDANLIGAGAIVTRSTASGQAVVPAASRPSDRPPASYEL